MKMRMLVVVLAMLIVVIGGDDCLGQETTLAAHKWEKIEYPPLPAMPDGVVPMGPRIVPRDKTSFSLMYWCVSSDAEPSRKFDEADKMIVRLHLPDGTVQDPLPNRQRGGFGSMGSTAWIYDYPFSWGANALDEGWIEMKMTGKTYWVEIPYGFMRDPAAPLAPVAAKRGRPTIVPAMKGMGANDRIIPWHHVTYDLGEIQNHWRLSVEVANPFDAHATATLYRNDSAVGKSMFLWNMKTPTTGFGLLDLDRSYAGRLVDLHLHSDGMRRSDTFELGRNSGENDSRGWGTMHVTVEKESYSFTVPSSLFKYVHGTAEPYSKQMIPRTYLRLED